MRENQFGKLSKIHLEASFRDDKTILSDVSFTAPYKVMHPLYEKKDRMSVIVLMASAGIMAGDRQEMNLTVRKGASMELISQAYEKIHKMEEGHAERLTKVVVEKEGTLYFTPLPVIPFHDSDFRSVTEIDLEDARARLVFTEVLSCGRVAHGEEFEYRRFKNRVSVRTGGRLVYFDNADYNPGQMPMRGFGLYEGFTHLSNMLICNMKQSDAWIAAVRQMIEEDPETEGGLTTTGYGDLVIRIFGRSGEYLTRLQEKILELSL